MDKVLKIYYSNNGVEAPFPNSELQAELYSFQYDCKRMGTAPNITASVMYPLCLDNDWTDDTYVYFRGEKYFIENTPSSSYSNQDTRYKHEITFVSERKALENIYFKDSLNSVNPSQKTLMDFSFFGDLNFFVQRLNTSLSNDGIGYTAIVDSGITTEGKDIHIENMYILDALQLAVEQFAIPYYFVGKTIHFGNYQTEITTPFKYGINDALLSINRENTNSKKANKITGVGSSENIPYYYPNFNESGEHLINTNPSTLESNIESINYHKIDPYTNLRNGGSATFYKATIGALGSDEEDKVEININNKIEYGFIHTREESWTTVYNSITQRFDIEKRFDIIIDIYTKEISNQNIDISRILKIQRAGNAEESITLNKNGDVYGYYHPKYPDESVIGTDIINDNFSQLSELFRINTGKYYKIQIKLLGNYKRDYATSFTSNYTITYDTKYTTNKRKLIVNGTDIDETVYSDFYKEIELNTNDYSNAFLYTVKREVAAYSTFHLDTAFKARFKGESEYQKFYPMSGRITITDDSNNIYPYWLSDDNHVHCRNNTASPKVFTIRMQNVNVYLRGSSVPITLELSYTPSFGRYEKSYDWFRFNPKTKSTDVRKYSVSGIKFKNVSSVADGSVINFSPTINWIEPKQNLMPYKYRQTLGNEMFYLAENDKYVDADGNDIVFENPYDSNRVKELIAETKEDIKPTILGVTNSQGQRIDMFADIAFDTNDNNAWKITDDGESQELEHSFFFVKLRKTDGADGFNLFDQALESGEMTISMTSGQCSACDFTIMVDDDGKNTVQVDSNGDLLRDADGNVEFGTPQNIQQDTSNAEVWIALRKSEDDYGIVLPDKVNNIIPTTNDTFVITNILLPNQYIVNAEKKLENELLNELLENNSEKYNYSIDFSRIYLAENKSVYDSLNENAYVTIRYNNKDYKLYVSSYSYKMESDKSLPNIKVELVDKLTITKNILEITSNNIIKKVESIVIDNSRQTRGGKGSGGSLELAQTTGSSTTKAMSQKAVTDALNAIESGNKVDIVQSIGSSTAKVMSQKAVTDEINGLKELISENEIEIVQETGSSTTKVMSQKATTDAIDKVDNVLPFNGFIDDAEISFQRNPYEGGKIYFVKSKNRFAYYRESDNLYTAMWNGYTRYATVSGMDAIPNSDTLFINDSKVYIFDGTTLVRVGSDYKDEIPKFTEIVSRARVINSTSFSNDGEVVYIINPIDVDNDNLPIFAYKVDGEYYRSWSSVYDYMLSDLSSPIPNKLYEYNKQQYTYSESDRELKILENTYNFWEKL